MKRMSAPHVEELDVVAANIGDVRDPYEDYARARREHAVARVTHFGADVAMVYSFAEAEQVLGDSETFSSRINGAWMRPFLGRTILEMDGLEHHSHRRLISHAFRRKVVQQWEDELIRPTAHELIDRFAARGRAELVREFAWEFPVRIIAKMVGVPQTDYAMWQQKAIELERTAVDFPGAIAASQELKEYFAPIVDERRWSQPERFDIHRKPQNHLAFADGEHFCLGAHLARIEGAVALNVILDRLEDLRLDPGAPEPYEVGFAFRSPTAVPVLFEGA